MHQTNKNHTNKSEKASLCSFLETLRRHNINTIDAVYLSFYLKAVGYNTIANVEIKVLSAENLAKAIKGSCF